MFTIGSSSTDHSSIALPIVPSKTCKQSFFVQVGCSTAILDDKRVNNLPVTVRHVKTLSGARIGLSAQLLQSVKSLSHTQHSGQRIINVCQAYDVCQAPQSPCPTSPMSQCFFFFDRAFSNSFKRHNVELKPVVQKHMICSVCALHHLDRNAHVTL